MWVSHAVEDMESNYGLRESLHFAERGVRNMVKGLPHDEKL